MTTEKQYSEKLLKEGDLLENWTERHVHEFLQECGFSAGIANTFLKEEITGIMLQFVDEAVLRDSLKISKLSDRLKLLTAFKFLRKRFKNSYSKHAVRKIRDLIVLTNRDYQGLTEKERVEVVYQKLKKVYPAIDEETLRTNAEAYSSPESIISQFLDPGLKNLREELTTELARLAPKIKLETEFSNKLSLVEEDIDEVLPVLNMKKKKKPMTEEKTATTVAPTEEDIQAEAVRSLRDALKSLEMIKLGKTIKVKLVFVENVRTGFENLVRGITSELMTATGTAPKYGIIHSALIVGPWYLEWNTSAIIKPRPCVSNAAVFAMDVENNLAELPLDEVIQKISKVITDWNTTKHYDQLKVNCQDFVDDLCHELGIEIKLSGPAKEYVERLRKKGVCKIKYKPCKEVQVRFNLARKHVFKTHKQLDTFYDALVQKEPGFPQKYKNDYMLLKAFDRAFWLRHLKEPKILDAQPNSPCPFGDPRGSSLVSW